MPIFLQAFAFICTYVFDAGSSPAKIVASFGVIPRFFKLTIFLFKFSFISSATFLPSSINGLFILLTSYILRNTLCPDDRLFIHIAPLWFFPSMSSVTIRFFIQNFLFLKQYLFDKKDAEIQFS